MSVDISVDMSVDTTHSKIDPNWRHSSLRAADYAYGNVIRWHPRVFPNTLVIERELEKET